MFDESKTTKFKAWLELQGAAVFPPTNPYELVRFKTIEGWHIIYTGKRGYTFTGKAQIAYNRFLQNKDWRTQDPTRIRMTQRKKEIALRDGKKCFWCLDETLGFNELTAEHILSKRHGGSDNIHNLSLACVDCQEALGTLPVVEKILLREKLIAQREEGHHHSALPASPAEKETIIPTYKAKRHRFLSLLRR